MPPTDLQAWLAFFGVAAGSITAIGVLIGGLYRLTVGRTVARILKAVTAVEEQLDRSTHWR